MTGVRAGRFSREGVFLVVLFFAGFAKAEPFTDFFSETRTYRAEFNQTVLDEEMNVLERSSGMFVLSRPGRFLWAYGEPIAQSIVADGRRLWIYDPGLDQAIVRWQGKGLGDTPAGLLANTEDPSANYLIERLGEQTGSIGYPFFLSQRTALSLKSSSGLSGMSFVLSRCSII